MNRENRILILSGVGLLALTMFFGFWYAIFDEHQTLNAMGFALATGFMEAAGSNLNGAYEALDQYGALSREYRQEIHFHGHFAFLGLTMILFGLVAHTLAYGERTRVQVASLMAMPPGSANSWMRAAIFVALPSARTSRRASPPTSPTITMPV